MSKFPNASVGKRTEKMVRYKWRKFLMDSDGFITIPREAGKFEKFIKDLWHILPKKLKTKELEKNKDMTLKYPWLLMTNRWNGKLKLSWNEKGKFRIRPKSKGFMNPFYPIEADWIYEASPKLFIEFQDELLNYFDKELPHYKYEYRITDTKVKYGTLRWYTVAGTQQMYDIEKKYIKLLEEDMELEEW